MVTAKWRWDSCITYGDVSAAGPKGRTFSNQAFDHTCGTNPVRVGAGGLGVIRIRIRDTLN